MTYFDINDILNLLFDGRMIYDRFSFFAEGFWMFVFGAGLRGVQRVGNGST